MGARRIFLLSFYLILTSLIFFIHNSGEIKGKNIHFFFQDSDIKYKVEIALALDPSNGKVWTARAFDNKIAAAADTFMTSVYESVDVPFMFSLTKEAPLYNNERGVKMLYAIELPFFLLSLWYLLRSWKPKKDKYLFLFFLVLITLFINGLFLPVIYPVKLFPFVLVIRTVIFLGVSDWLLTRSWLKKYFS